MPTTDDLRAALRRLEARTPLESSAVAELVALTELPELGRPVPPSTLVELVPDRVPSRRRRGAVVGGALGVAAAIVTAVLISISVSGSDPGPAPVGGTPGPSTSPSVINSPSAGAPSTCAATAGPADTCAPASDQTSAVAQSTNTSAYRP